MKHWTLSHQHYYEEGNVLKWSITKPPSSDLLLQNQTMQDFCPHVFSSIVVLPGLRTYEDSILECEKFRSHVHIYTESVKQTIKTLDFLPVTNFWTGLILNTSTFTFEAKLDNGSVINFDETSNDWKWGEPNGRLIEQCASLMTLNGSLTEDGEFLRMTCVNDN